MVVFRNHHFEVLEHFRRILDVVLVVLGQVVLGNVRAQRVFGLLVIWVRVDFGFGVDSLLEELSVFFARLSEKQQYVGSCVGIEGLNGLYLVDFLVWYSCL